MTARGTARPATVDDHVVVLFAPGDERVVKVCRWSRRRTEVIGRERLDADHYSKERTIPVDAILRHEDGAPVASPTPLPPHRGKR